MSRPEDDGFLSRWSKRKLAEPDPDAVPSESEEAADVAPEELVAEQTDAEVLEELGLPDPDTLEKGDDFSSFMNGAVPTRLRNRALRKLWLTNPVLANIDELVDYGEDFTDAATVVENMQTAYQVGKGWLRDVTAEEEDEESAPESEDQQPETSPDEEVLVSDLDDEGIPTGEIPAEPENVAALADTGEEQALAANDIAAFPSDPEPETIRPPRRMRFQFENG